MHPTCPPGITGVALAVSSCPTARYCCIRLLLLDGPVLLILLWPSQAVRRPGVTGVALAVSSCRRPSTAGTAVSVSYCLTARYCWYCSGHLKLFDGQVLLQRCFPLNRQLQLLQVGELPFSFSYEKKI